MLKRHMTVVVAVVGMCLVATTEIAARSTSAAFATSTPGHNNHRRRTVSTSQQQQRFLSLWTTNVPSIPFNCLRLPKQKGRFSIDVSSTRLNNAVPSIGAAAATAVGFSSSLSSSGTVLVRMALVRALALVYSVSFVIALSQNKALIGDDGITPAKRVLDQAQTRGTLKRHQRSWQFKSRQQRWQSSDGNASSRPRQIKSRWFTTHIARSTLGRGMSRIVHRISSALVYGREVWWDRCDRSDRPVTTLLWLAHDRTELNPWLDAMAVNGLALSVAVAVTGAANVPCLLAIWLCHRSLMAVGGPWYAYGWEPQLAELGFHALFCVPLLSLDPYCPVPIPPPVHWCMRWYLFRIMMGSGLIKLRSGDEKWKNLTAMNFFYETQPVPNPLTRYFHWLPSTWHKAEVVFNHFVELFVPWLWVLPGVPVSVRRASGLILLTFQTFLIASGNFSYLNWLTMVPAILCLDDAFLGHFVAPATRSAARTAAASAWLHTSITRQIVNLAFLALVLKLSRPVVQNLLSPEQAMNRSFDPLRLVNTYGAFGTVNEDRKEFIISSAPHWDGPWKEYEFKVKPGNVHRGPRFVSPYHYRLDWEMWIAASSGSIDHSPWIYPFLIKLLQQDEAVLNGLMAGDPWQDAPVPPKYIRIEQYRYAFHKPSKDAQNPPYWDRKLLGPVYPKQGLATIESLEAQQGAR